MPRRALFAVLATSAALSLVAAPQLAGAGPAVGSTRVFAHVESPGMPEGIAVDPRSGVAYVGTNAPAAGNPGAGPSKVFAYSLATGQKVGEHEVAGQRLDETHGVVGFAPGGRNEVYVADRTPARILRIDFSSAVPTQQTYATLPDLRPCAMGTAPCSQTASDLAPYPDGVAFDHAGNLYVSDFQQATIFRIPPGGGPAQVWFTDQRLESPFGPNGLAIDKSRRTLYFATTGAAVPPLTGRGIIYTLPLGGTPTADHLTAFFTYPEPAAGPDGIAFGKSGRLYVALAGFNAISVLSPDGREIARFPDAVSNAQQDVPYDMPASIAFNDATRSILVTNHTYATTYPGHWVVFEVFVDDVAPKLAQPE